MIEDPIVNEIRKFRQAHAKAHDNDLKKIIAALHSHRDASRHYINRGPKKLLERKQG